MKAIITDHQINVSNGEYEFWERDLSLFSFFVFLLALLMLSWNAQSPSNRCAYKEVAVTGKYDSECHTHVIPSNCGVNQTAMLRVLIIIPAIKVNMNWNCQHAKFRHCVNILNSNWATCQYMYQSAAATTMD